MDERLNRKTPPPIKNWNDPLPLKIEKVRLDNGLVIYFVDAGTQELMKIQGLFNAGVRYQDKAFVAKFTNALVPEGSRQYSARQIAEALDSHGAYLNNNTGLDTGTIGFYVLNKHFPAMMPVIEDIIKNPVFPEEEVEIYKNNSYQDFRVKLEKVDFLAKRWFHRQVYGTDHPFGKIGSLEDFDKITRQDLVDFHAQSYSAQSCKVIATGKIPKDFLKIMDKHFGKDDFTTREIPGRPVSMEGLPAPRKEYFPKKNALQSAIYIGKPLFSRTHPDYFDFNIMNTVLGGYFGSRLMKNIREDKGFTYGIGSRLASHHSGGTFSISAQVSAQHTREALQEIYKEIERLQNFLVSDDELETVKNYLSGQILQSMDGLFSISNIATRLVEYGLDISYMEDYFARINSIQANDIRDIAQKYLAIDSLHELVVGQME